MNTEDQYQQIILQTNEWFDLKISQLQMVISRENDSKIVFEDDKGEKVELPEELKKGFIFGIQSAIEIFGKFPVKITKNNKNTMLNYEKLMSNDPTVYGKMINSRGQEIEFVEHPQLGDEAEVICVCHELELASYSGFFETDDMEADHKEYEPSFVDGKFVIGQFVELTPKEQRKQEIISDYNSRKQTLVDYATNNVSKLNIPQLDLVKKIVDGEFSVYLEKDGSYTLTKI